MCVKGLTSPQSVNKLFQKECYCKCQMCQMHACFSTATKHYSRKIKKCGIWKIIKLANWLLHLWGKAKSSSLRARHLYYILQSVNAPKPKKEKKSLCKCHCLGIIVSRNKDHRPQWWMWMLFFHWAKESMGLTHFRPICDCDVWRMYGREERNEAVWRGCEKGIKLSGVSMSFLHLLFKTKKRNKFIASR